MELLFGITVGLLILVFLVVVHELGHAIVAKRNGVVVEEFGIGFPPRAWSKRLKNGVLLTLNYLPLGGFVKLQGEYDSADKKGDYGAATYWQKTRIILAGVLINWVVAVVLLSGLALVGLPKVLPNQFSVASDTSIIKKPIEITLVSPNSPAAAAGIEVGDQIVRFNGVPVETPADLSNATEANKGNEVEIIYSRDNVESVATTKLRDESNQGYLGAASGQRELIQAGWSAPVVGLVTTAQFTMVTFQGLGDLLVNFVKGVVLQLSFSESVREEGSDSLSAASENVAGPIGILGTIFPAAEQAGLTQLVFLTAIISLTLAVMNALPIPALDGGRWFTMTIFKLLKRPLTQDTEEKIQATGFLLLMGLIILVTIADVGKLF